MDPGRATEAGAQMAAEIAEQPASWERMLRHPGEIESAARAVVAARPRFVLLAARGSSDHAALYAKYLIEITLGLPAGLVSPSSLTAYGARPQLRDVLLIAVSQSGGSPDLVQTVEAARAGGALTLAVTNDSASSAARAAEVHVDIRAGPERSVAATKSYTAQLLALYLLLDRVGGGNGRAADGLPGLGQAVLERAATEMPGCADRYRFAQRLVVTGRGYAYPTAREAALKLMETSYVSAQAFSGADLLHGPVALLEPQVPVLAVVPAGVAGAAMAPVLPRVQDTRADLFVVGAPDAVARAGRGFALPGGVEEALSPLLEILPLQILALRLAVARQENPDAPRGLRKVTETT